MKNNILETISTTVLMCIAVLLLNPFDMWMPDMMVTSMLVIGLLVFGIFAGFMLQEKSGDERENSHRALAGRNAFLVGSSVLVLGILVQGYTHTVDGWLVIALVSMIVSKFLTRAWSDKNM